MKLIIALPMILMCACAHSWSNKEWRELSAAIESNNVEAVKRSLQQDFGTPLLRIKDVNDEVNSEAIVVKATGRVYGSGTCRNHEILMMLIKAGGTIDANAIQNAALNDCPQQLSVLLSNVNRVYAQMFSSRWLKSRNDSKSLEDSERVAAVFLNFIKDYCLERRWQNCPDAERFKNDWDKVKLAIEAHHQERLDEEKRQEQYAREQTEREHREAEAQKTRRKLNLEYNRRALNMAEKNGATHIIVGLYGSVARGFCREQLNGGAVCDRGAIICNLPVFKKFVAQSSKDPENYIEHLNTMFRDSSCNQGVAAEEFFLSINKPLNEGFVDILPVRRGANTILGNKLTNARWEAATWVEVGPRQEGDNEYRLAH